MKYKKSQIANEFMILIAIMIFVSILFLAVLRNYADDISTTKEEKTLSDYGTYLQNEFITASQVNDGYVRELILPNNMGGYEYYVSNTNSSIKLISQRSKIEFFYRIPSVEGSLSKGYNKIVKKGGVIYIQ